MTIDAILPIDARLAGASRLQTAAGDRARNARLELAVLLFTGGLAAVLSAFVDLDLGIPGHHIVFSVFPMALGLALVPRRGSGTVMGASAVATTTLLGFAGAHLPGIGALTSLALIGPFLDAALRWGKQSWQLYAAFVLAGAATNGVAFAVRATAKALGMRGMGGGRGMSAWLPQAVWTYAIAGVVAGLISAAVWFHQRDRASHQT